jgi:CheY-like chemotaxis protein
MAGETGAGEIFIVDDDPGICTVLSLLFSREGYQATCFSDGASLLAATHGRTPACIVLDVHIPGRSGLDILKELNAQNYPAPIFIMSGHGDIRQSMPSGTGHSISSRSRFGAARLSRVCARQSKLWPAVLQMKWAPMRLGSFCLPVVSR